MSEQELGRIQGEIGKIQGTMEALITSHRDLSQKVNIVYEKSTSDQRLFDGQLDQYRRDVYTEIGKIQADVSWLKNRYWLFVGGMTVIVFIINALPWLIEFFRGA